MRHGHGRRAHFGLAVDLGLVLLDHFRVVATQPLAADREAAEALAFRNAGHLQQRQRTATGAEEDEARVDLALLAALGVLHLRGPALGAARQVGDLLAVADGDAALGGQELQQLVGQGAEVDVGTVGGAGCGDAFAGIAASHHQRHPLGHGGLVFGVLHAFEGVVLLEQLMAFLEEADILLATHEAQVRHRVDEVTRRAEARLAGQVRPELLGDLELGVDLHGLLDVDRAVRRLRRVVQLAEAGMAGTRVVPRVGALDGARRTQLGDLQLEARVQFLEQHRQGGAHDAGADQQHIHSFVIDLRH